MPFISTSRRRPLAPTASNGLARDASAGTRWRIAGPSGSATTYWGKGMFTGIIETVGEVAEVKPTPAGFRLRLSTALSADLSPGESVAVNGVCLTVVSADADGVHMDVSPETIRVSTLGSLKRGSAVN